MTNYRVSDELRSKMFDAASWAKSNGNWQVSLGGRKNYKEIAALPIKSAPSPEELLDLLADSDDERKEIQRLSKAIVDRELQLQSLLPEWKANLDLATATIAGLTAENEHLKARHAGAVQQAGRDGNLAVDEIKRLTAERDEAIADEKNTLNHLTDDIIMRDERIADLEAQLGKERERK